MYRMEESSAFLREKTYTAARSTIQEYVALFNGLSRKIIYLADRVKGLRACLVVRSPHSKYSASRINNGINSPPARKNVVAGKQETMDNRFTC